MSGGTYNGKLARPLAQAGLFIKIDSDDLFKPREKEKILVEKGTFSMQTVYGKWPMGVDGFITTNNCDEALRQIRDAGYEAMSCGQLQRNEKTGVEIHTYKREIVRFEGK